MVYTIARKSLPMRTAFFSASFFVLPQCRVVHICMTAFSVSTMPAHHLPVYVCLSVHQPRIAKAIFIHNLFQRLFLQKFYLHVLAANVHYKRNISEVIAMPLKIKVVQWHIVSCNQLDFLSCTATYKCCHSMNLSCIMCAHTIRKEYMC